MLVDAGTAAYKAAEAKNAPSARRGRRDRSMHPVPTVTNSIARTCFPEPRRRIEMIYSRRNFLKAAGSGVALTFIGGRNSLSLGRGSSGSCDGDDQGESDVHH